MTRVKKFTDRKKAVARIWAELQKLGGPEAPQDAHVAPEEAPSKKKGSRAKKAPQPAKKAAKPAGGGPRATSKTAQLVEMLIHLVQATLGHRSVATTSRYLHARPGESGAEYLAV